MHSIHRAILAGVATAAVCAAPAAAFAQGVSPATVTEAMDPGASIHVTKTVTTPVVPPKPDIVLLVDTTGSMGGAIANVQAGMANIITTVQAAQPTAQFAVSEYRDYDKSSFAFRVDSGLTGDTTATTTAVNALSAGQGGDVPEAQINALYQLGSGGNAVAFRPDSSRIIVWFGDASGHDPSNGYSLADATASLTGAGAKVIAVGVKTDFGDGLNATGQASDVTTATGGTYFAGVAPDAVAAAILAGLQNLPAEVTASPTCDAGLTVSLSPVSQTVPSGSDAVFDETITVAPDAPQGGTLSCTTAFRINGVDAGPEFVQTITVTVNDVTPPTTSCGPGVNPAGHTPPAYMRAGFYSLLAADNLPGVTVSITDPVSGATFGPYDPGTMIHLTQAPGATPSATPGSGHVDWDVKLKGDALVTAIDAAGNTATAMCTVPPDHK